MGATDILRVLEVAIPILSKFHKSKNKEFLLIEHDLFHFLYLIDRNKFNFKDSKQKKVFLSIAKNYHIAFKDLLEEPQKTLFQVEFWEKFMRDRQKMITMNSSINKEFFHLEKLLFQGLKDGIFQSKNEFLYYVFSLYLLYLKIIVDEG